MEESGLRGTNRKSARGNKREKDLNRKGKLKSQLGRNKIRHKIIGMIWEHVRGLRPWHCQEG